MRSCSFIIVLLLGLMSREALSQCRDATLESLKKEAKEKGAIKLVFFSSWCSTCQHKLQASELSEQTYFVASFDNRRSANKVAEHLKFKPGHCIYDDGDVLAKQLNVDGVPAERTLEAR